MTRRTWYIVPLSLRDTSPTRGLPIFAFRITSLTGGLVLICAQWVSTAMMLAIIDIVGCKMTLWVRRRHVWRLLAPIRGRLELGLDDSFQYRLNGVMLVGVVMRILNDERTKLKP